MKGQQRRLTLTVRVKLYGPSASLDRQKGTCNPKQAVKQANLTMRLPSNPSPRTAELRGVHLNTTPDKTVNVPKPHLLTANPKTYYKP